MLSHLRFHRRGPASTPSSPLPDQQPPSPFTNQPPALSADSISPYDASPSSSSSTALPPFLPPITRVTSTESEPQGDRWRMPEAMSPPDPRPQPPPKKSTNESSFMGGLALQNYKKGMGNQAQARPETADGSTSASSDPRARSHIQPSLTSYPEVPTRPPPLPNSQPRSASSFTTPTELSHSSTAGTGKRPAGARMASEPPVMSASATYAEPQKGKKSLPFLKNPMSTLLMRRKNSHNVPDLLPLPLQKEEEPTYDPRIRGTRVHDFSAPRRKHQTPHSDATSSQSPTKRDQGTDAKKEVAPAFDSSSTLVQPTASSASESASTSIISQTVGPSTSASSRKTKASAEQAAGSSSQDAPPVPPKDETDIVKAQQSRRTHITLQDGPSHTKSVASMRSGQSRKVSLAERTNRDTISSIPKHMKSTSSRFSFDMIGAAKQEKLLEERHRQREAERQIAEPADPRDSRIDDFDEDAMYDAMMEDDGLEEEIPGVSFDYEEDDFMVQEDDMMEPDPAQDDPDNDQENFEGFVFQRSNPTSALASPHFGTDVQTPRDASGQVIGFAVGGDTPKMQLPSLAPLSPFSPDFDEAGQESHLSGLGLQNVLTSKPLDASRSPMQPQHPESAFAAPPQNQQRDELDFGSGVMSGFENEFAEDLAADVDRDAAPFDESIFDNNDTDEYGRPVPGAFAQAQSLRRAAKQGSVKRESDMTSRFSAQSAVDRSTAHTSLSVEIPKPIREEDESTRYTESNAASAIDPQGHEKAAAEDPMAVYQAALAAAAHKAVASGKFERDPSPIKEDPSGSSDEFEEELGFDPDAYEDDEDDMHMSNKGFDDYELDDDAIIAEANADMLAYDSDYYGQEFGFYSAPMTHHGSVNSQSSDDSDYSFAGGFFAPKGVDIVNRSKSGRIVSREPNLTPITERSEYSNRNSVMSLAVPPLMSGTPNIQSPGLAQLAMMADRGDDQMSLSALMRLRSKAWGGSQISLSSSREGSPRSDRGESLSSPWGAQAGGFFPAPNPGHLRKNSVFSTMSRESEANSATGSPTLTSIDLAAFSPSPITGQHIPPVPAFQDSPAEVNSPLAMGAGAYAVDSVETPASAMSTGDWNWGNQPQPPPAGSRRPGMGHRPKGSADSISYIQEEEGGGETRWVMERRRTGESGQIELLEREIVEGGRI